MTTTAALHGALLPCAPSSPWRWRLSPCRRRMRSTASCSPAVGRAACPRGGAVHLRRLQLLPAGRPLAVEAEGPARRVALAFHVDYWDRLGWPDRFASAGLPQRQAQLRAATARVMPTRRRWWSTAATSPAGRAWPGRRTPAGQRAGDAQPTATAIAPKCSALPGAPHAHRRLLGADRGRPCQRRQGRREQRRHAGPRLRGARIRRVAPGTRRDTAREAALQPPPVDTAHPRRVNLVLVDADTAVRCRRWR